MKLAERTWQDIESADRNAVVVIPTGSLEQHGPHLPLFTDSILATSAAEAAEKRLGDKIILTPTLWLGASAHHLAFPGSLSHSFEGYISAIDQIVESLWRHGYKRFYIVNGHGGNNSPNDMAMRNLKERHPEGTFGIGNYFSFIPGSALAQMKGPHKGIRHACEAETSLMMHLRPDLVRKEKIRDDGLAPDPDVKGVVHTFDEITEEGSLGYATFATPELGKLLFEAAVEGLATELERIYGGYVLLGDR